MADAFQNQPGGGSLSDLITATKNLVVAVNALAQTYLNIEGAQNFTALAAPTVVKASSGRIARISVIVGGSATGFVYDSGSLPVTTRPLYVIPTAVGVYEVNLPASFGVLVSPGSGQTVSGSYS